MGATRASVSATLFDKEITGFSIDSRTIGAGELFFALSQEDYTRAGFNGEFADAHLFIPQAFARGAIAAVARADRVREDAGLQALGDRLLLVEDVIAALQTLARKVYEGWGRAVVGITGSAGKTTTKDLTAHVLSATGERVLKSQRNYNNGLGLPLSILQMVTGGHTPGDYDMAVLEMGMSSPTGEIARLCRITPPDVGVELCVTAAHLEYFGTIERIAEAKAELIQGLKPGGIAVLNADDAMVAAMRGLHEGRNLTFGIENRADVMATEIVTAELGLIRFNLRTPGGFAKAKLAMPGRHNLMNALAAATVATCFGVEPEEIATALATCHASEMRGEVLDFAAGFTVVDDSYNSNPRALLNMVRTLAESGSRAKRRIVIAGEMLELGSESEQLHLETGREIERAGVDLLWGVRGMARFIIKGALEMGISDERLRFFDSSEEAGAALLGELRAGDLVLVKGSRGVRTDRIVKLLRDRFPLVGADEK
jgi:UDP-N-acetylmuramoyl-tripeptide--D-alanyl-D-alanine ligase